MIGGIALGLVIAVAASALGLAGLKALMRAMIADNFAGKEAPFMAWRLFSARQLEMLLREVSPSLPHFLSRRETMALSERIRKKHRGRIRSFETMEEVEEVVAYMRESNLPLPSGVCENIARTLSGFDEQSTILRSIKPAEYHPFEPPKGPIRFPAEHETIRSVLLAWPTQYAERWTHHAQLAALISQRASAHIVVPNPTWAAVVTAFLDSAGAKKEGVRFICAPNDDVWIRDFGPTLVATARGPAFIANPYVPNGLGFHKRDQELPVEIARLYGLPVHRLPVVIEGGNLLSDGAGRLFLADSVFEHNPDLDARELGDMMARWFGATELTILPALPGELTGHVDIALKLSSAGGAWVTEAPSGHPWRAALEEVAAIVARTKSPNGQFYRVVRMPMAAARSGSSEFCYCNALTLNGAVLMPRYAAETDRLAEAAFQALEPDASLHGIDFSHFRVGALHCQTKEVAAL